MKRITILAMLLVMCSFISKAQSFKVYLNNGTNVEYNTTDVDSIVLIDAPTTIYYGVGTAIPTSEAEIKQLGTSYTTTSISATISNINCEDIKTVWIAVPSDWHLTYWKDSDGDDGLDTFTQVTDSTVSGWNYCTLGSYLMYYMKQAMYINQTYTITASK